VTVRSPRGRIGTTIRDKYRVDTFIATGSMANVYAATHRNGGRVALKILHRELASDPQMRERFKREGYFCNAIEHPAIAKAIDDDVTEDDCPFIVMELLEGENLEVRRKRVGGRLPIGEVLSVADSVLDVLAAAHDKGVLHRDLKPENVFLTHDGKVKLLDFGVARWNDGKQSSEVTGIGMVLGTPAFMPPEQALGLREEVDARSDIWALGATLFTLLTGESVHTGDNAKAKLVATATKPARKLREVLPSLPTSVTSVIDRALEYHRSERWDDANAMREALRWSRMSVDPEAEVMTSSSPMVAAASIEATRRVRSFVDDEPTVMRKALAEEEVFTSAPPVTARSTLPRATIPDEPPTPALSESGESIAFSLRNDPVFSLRRTPDKKGESEAPPNTQRLPGGEPFASDEPNTQPGLGPPMQVQKNERDDDLGLPHLPGSDGPISEDVRMEYTRPIMVPGGLRGTLPLSPGSPGAPGQTGSGIVPVPPPPPSNPQLSPTVSAPPASGPSGPHAIPSQPNPAPPPSNTGSKVLLSLLLVAMLGGTVLVLWMKKHPHAAATATTVAPAPPSAAPSETASASPSASPIAEPGAFAQMPVPPVASAEAVPSASAMASASAAPSATATVVAAKPKPRPKPPVTASTASAEEAPSTAPAAVPVPLPTPTPDESSP
jgi:eukaryotic-like serine/threonine-protein kinase